MENKFIIGGAVIVVAIIGFYIYSMPVAKAPDTLQSNNVVADVTEDAATTTNSTTTTATTTSINNPKTTNTKMKATYTVKMETTKGPIVLELDTNIAPKTVTNFLKLIDSGFYNGVKFHRVIKDFMIQAGDPNSKDDSKVNTWGQGGPGYKFEDELTDVATYKNGYKRGILAMANSGPNTNGSQFFIMHKDTPLPPSYTIFGHVISGLETVDAIASSKTGQADRPIEAIIITKITLE